MNQYVNYALLIVCLIAWGGCSGSGNTTTPEPQPEVLAWNGLAFSETGINLKDVNSGNQSALIPGAGSVEIVSQSEEGDLLVMSYQLNDSTSLALVDAASMAITVWHSLPGMASYTGVWSADEQAFAFGFISGNQGGISVANRTTGELESVGCSASNTVLGWPDHDKLIVASGDDVYVVNVQGCGTLKTLDMRKKSALAVSPDGSRIAYILRELEYNRDTRSYEPDSALYIADYMDANPIQIAGQRYSPRRMAWSPDGSKLAYDVVSQQAEGKRSLALYDVESGESTFLVRPDPLGIPSETSPRWSPDGTFVIYNRYFEEAGLYQKGARSLIDNAFLVLAEGDQQAEMMSWVGGDAILLAIGDSTRVVPLSGMQPRVLENGSGVFWLPDAN